MQTVFTAGDQPSEELTSSSLTHLVAIRTKSLMGYAPQKTWQPDINIYETERAYYVCAELAGVRASDIDVRTDKGLLVISGHRDDPRPRHHQGSLCVYLMEVDSGDFQRQVRLPPEVDVERIEACYRGGFLWVTLPKSDPR